MKMIANTSLPNGIINIKENTRYKEIETTANERLILLILFKLENPISILQIKHILIKKLNKDISTTIFYSSLDRMKINKLVDYKYSDKTNSRVGKVKKLYFITDLGKKNIIELVNSIKVLME